MDADNPDSARSASLSIVDSNLLIRSNRTVVSGTVVGNDRMACTARAGAWTGTVSASRIANILKLCCSSSSRLANAALCGLGCGAPDCPNQSEAGEG